jgi:type I restriction enzyme S subunit
MNNWIEETIGDICLKVTDGSHYSPRDIEDGYPMLSVKDMTENGFDYTNVKKISKEDYLKLVRGDCKPKKYDVLIAKDGSYLKHVFVCNEEKEEVILSSIAILRPNRDKIDPDYFKQLLRTPSVKGMMESFVSGSALPRIVLKDFKKMKLSLPPLPIQQRIASILSAYDDLIEVNNQRIKLLEETARELYKEWFVRMRFPGYQQAKFVKGVPEGWEITTLADEVNFKMGQSPKSEFYNNAGNGLPFHQGVGTYGERFPEHKIFCSTNGRTAEEGDILFSVRAPVGRLNIADRKLIIGRGLSAMRHKKGLNNYLYYLLQHEFSKEDTIGNGSIFNSVGKDELKRFKIFHVGDIAKQFNSWVKPIDDQLLIFIQQNTQLRQIRDRLLPRLISGKLEVK